MLEWILAGLAVYMVYIFTPSVFYVGRVGVIAALGPRDNALAPSVHHGRAMRAVLNYKESLPIFLVLAVLALVLPGADQSMATQGAMIAVLSRIVYLPLYIFGVPFLRSAAWMFSWVGFAMMTIALL